jgi:hypothetical protein
MAGITTPRRWKGHTAGSLNKIDDPRQRQVQKHAWRQRDVFAPSLSKPTALIFLFGKGVRETPRPAEQFEYGDSTRRLHLRRSLLV